MFGRGQGVGIHLFGDQPIPRRTWVYSNLSKISNPALVKTPAGWRLVARGAALPVHQGSRARIRGQGHPG